MTLIEAVHKAGTLGLRFTYSTVAGVVTEFLYVDRLNISAIDVVYIPPALHGNWYASHFL